MHGPAALIKRQRSNSADSTASSSKRGSPSVGAMAAMEIGARPDNINGEDSSSTSSSGSSNATEPLVSTSTAPSIAQLPDGQAQLDTVLPELRGNGSKLREGDSWFVVDRKWYRRWQAACGSADDKEMQDISLNDVGPIDNRAFADPVTGKLTKPVTEGQDVVLLPVSAWHVLVSWYGTSGKAVQREVIQLADGPLIDLDPPEFVLHKVVPANSTNQPSAPVKLQTSSGWTMLQTKKEIAKALGLDPSVSSRLWLVSDQYSEGAIAADKLASEELDTTEDGQTLRTSTLQEGNHLALEQANEDGAWLAAIGLTAPAAPVTPRPIFGGKGFVDNMQAQHDDANAKKRAALSTTAFAPSKPQGGTDMRVTRSQTGNSGGKRGLVGLANLGNTCFMNSALQCLSNTPSLQQYFHSGFYKTELNPDNPLGMNGEVAKAFGTLIERIWAGGNSPVTPREFKQTLSKFAPAFSGWQQHDSQELLAFLLDGLHEDLNRIKKKPYDDIPDWEGGGDKEEMALATTSWELYKKRNDSVIVDLFQGQYRSRLTCPECGKIAIKFDPFMYLSLAIPQNKKWISDVYLVPLDTKRSQIKVSVEIPFNTSMRKLKQILGEMTGYDHKKLFVAEEWSRKFFRVWSDSDSPSSGQKDDLFVFYELPYEVEQPTFRPAKAKTLQQEGKIVVTVLNFRSIESNFNRHNSDKALGEPFILGLTREEACDIRLIQAKICERLASWRGVGDKIWADAESSGTTGEAQNSGKSMRKDVIPDDEEGEAVSPTEEPAGESSSQASAVSSGPRRHDENRIIFHVEKEGHHKPFIGDVPSYRMRQRLGERLAERKKREEPTTMPGGFVTEASPDLYGDDAAQTNGTDAPPAVAQGSSETACRQPIVDVGEIISVEWENGFAAEVFGDDIDKGRTDDVECLSAQEAVIAESIQERKRAGGKGNKAKQLGVEDLLDEFTTEEKLSEDNMWYCPTCKKHQEAQKKFDLWKMPDVLVIHLKRFSNERAFRDKIDTFIDFPIDGLDLSSRVEGKQVAKRLAESGELAAVEGEEVKEDESLVYDLFAVDNHFGGLGGGHYTSFCSNVNDGKWYNFDDSRVSPVNPESVKTPAAYLLFYKRRAEKLGGKTHDILTSQGVTPNLSKENSPDGDQSFRGENEAPPSYVPAGQYASGSQSYGDGLPHTGDGIDPALIGSGTGATAFDEDLDMFADLNSPAASPGGSGNVSDSSLPPAPGGIASLRKQTDDWQFSSFHTPDTPASEVEGEASVREIRLDPQAIARAASDVEMEADGGEMDELE